VIEKKAEELAQAAREQARDPLTPPRRVGALMDLAELLDAWVEEWRAANTPPTWKPHSGD
jgi:hypothetical protein